MYISAVEAFPLRCPLSEPFAYSHKRFTHQTALLVRVTTDDGIDGWGKVFCHDAGPALAVLIGRVLAPLIVGRDALSREVIWDLLCNWTRDYGQKGLTTAALSGIDIALWDIAGKATGLPVCKLFGASFRDRVPAYATGLYHTSRSAADTTALAEEAAPCVAQGFSAVTVEVGFGIARDVANVRVVRNAIGQATGLMVDAHHAYDVATAIELGKAIEQYRIGWFEEPVVPEDLDSHRAVRHAIDMPIGGGEAEFTRYGFRSLLSRGALDIVQPDICICGGISEARQIAAPAQAHHVRVVPHVWGTEVAIAAALHFLAALPPQPPSLNA